MSINGKVTGSNVDPHVVAQMLASLRGNRAQLAKLSNDLEILRERAEWNTDDWEKVFALNRQIDRVRELIRQGKIMLKAAGVDIERM